MSVYFRYLLYLLLSSLLMRICESFPFIKMGSKHMLTGTDKDASVLSSGFGEFVQDDTTLKDELSKRTEHLRKVRRSTVDAIALLLKYHILLHDSKADPKTHDTDKRSEKMPTIHKRFNVSSDYYSELNGQPNSQLTLLELLLQDPKIADVLKARTKHISSTDQRSRRSYFLGLDVGTAVPDTDTDVTFGAHTAPCDYKDRNYCLNGGTCMLVPAMDLQTCRCKIGYTGLRCHMINQEFLLHLLSEEFFG